MTSPITASVSSTATGTSFLGGLEIKIVTVKMQGLPEPQDIINECQVRYAIKNGALPQNREIRWIVAVGPYFVIYSAQFSEAE